MAETFFTIEIAIPEEECIMSCPTCPSAVRTMKGPYAKKIRETFKLLEERKLRNADYRLSFLGDVRNLTKHIEEFKIQYAPKQLASYVNLPLDGKVALGIFRQISERFPQINLDLASYVPGHAICINKYDQVFPIADAFFKSEISRLQVSFNTNFMSLRQFRDSRHSIQQLDEAMIDKLGNDFEIQPSMLTEYEKNYDLDMYDGTTFLQYSWVKTFIMSRRIIAKASKHFDTTMADYMDITRRAVKSELEFRADQVYITLTPIGVRINHRTTDIQNPYFWLTYDEFIYLLKRKGNLETLCFELHRVVLNSSAHPLDDSYMITSPAAISRMAAYRKIETIIK